VFILKEEKTKELEKKANEIRCLTIEMIGKLGVGHVGGSLSIIEALTTLYQNHMRVDPGNPKWEERDHFVLSKGHGGPGLYAVLADKGFFPKDWVETLNKPNTRLPSHCDRVLTPGIDMTAGSLGQGLSAAVGMAIVKKMDKKDSRVYCIIGDGESQEGQIWEASMLAGNKKLDNLTALLDHNKLQIDGTVKDINSIEPVADKWEAFGWHCITVNGHDVDEIDKGISEAKETKGQPTMIILNTVKGKGAFFAENKLSCHNMKVSTEDWKKAVAELNKAEV